MSHRQMMHIVKYIAFALEPNQCKIFRLDYLKAIQINIKYHSNFCTNSLLRTWRTKLLTLDTFVVLLSVTFVVETSGSVLSEELQNSIDIFF